MGQVEKDDLALLDLGVAERKAKANWPNLREENFELTSEVDPYYNCVAWAVRDRRNWWDPTDAPLYYWPHGAMRSYAVEAYVEAFATRHYALCDTSELEAGYEKIALYAIDGEFKHVARQLPDGRWSSKLGGIRDIAHNTLDALAGDFYGEPARFMRRPRAQEMARPRRARTTPRRQRR